MDYIYEIVINIVCLLSGAIGCYLVMRHRFETKLYNVTENFSRLQEHFKLNIGVDHEDVFEEVRINKLQMEIEAIHDKEVEDKKDDSYKYAVFGSIVFPFEQEET